MQLPIVVPAPVVTVLAHREGRLAPAPDQCGSERRNFTLHVVA
jgi:hypothetical protein